MCYRLPLGRPGFDLHWEPFAELTEARCYVSAVKINDNELWVTGGWTGWANRYRKIALAKTEYVFE